MPLLPSWAWWTVSLGACLACSLLTLRSVQLAATFVTVVTVVAVHLSSRRAGLVALWLTWLLMPFIRRLFGLSEGYDDADPLAAAPFVATAIIGSIELRRSTLSGRAKLVLFCGAAGLSFGIPAGLIYDPRAAAFAILAYGGTLLAFAAGYREDRRLETTLAAVLRIAGPPIALYAILQAMAPLPAWDDVWLKEVEFVSAGTQEEGTLRAFATLNSPGTLAVVLGLAVIGTLTARRFGPVQVVSLLILLAGIGVTLVRSVWVGLALALVLLVVLAPGRIGRRALIVAAVAVVAVPFVAGGSPIASNIGERAGTLGDVGGDTSAQARIATPQALVPVAIREPIGVGLGQAGEASRLTAQGALRATDNAFLSMLLQCGPVGLLLLATAVGLGLASAVRTMRRRRSASDLMVFGSLVMLVVLMLTGDVFYGVSGLALWYLIGVAVRGSDEQRTTLRAAT